MRTRSVRTRVARSVLDRILKACLRSNSYVGFSIGVFSSRLLPFCLLILIFIKNVIFASEVFLFEKYVVRGRSNVT